MEEKQMHEGHRERLTNLILNSGIDNVSEIQSVEYFLTYVFPRGDVNPLAHRLLDRYGSFANIVDAEVEDLKYIKGINDRSAKKIKLFSDLIGFYYSSKMKKRINLKNEKVFLDHIQRLLSLKNTETLYLFAIDSHYRLIQKKAFSMKEVRSVGIKPYELYTFINSTKLSYLAIAHNHPNGTANSSPDDQDAIEYIQNLTKNLNITILDSFVVGEDGIYSEKQKGFLRRYDDVDNLIKFFTPTK